MANTSLNTTNAIRQQVYSDYVQETLKDELLPLDFIFDMSGELSNGDTLNVPTSGEIQARTVSNSLAEDQEMIFDALDTGRITLTVDTYDYAGWYQSDKLKEDQYVDVVGMKALDEATRGMKIKFLTNVLAKHNSIQTASNTNASNGVAHRIVAQGSSAAMSLDDFAYAAYSLNMAHVPQEGRIAVLHPRAALTFDKAVNAQGFINNPMFEGMVTQGFRKNMTFIRNIAGFDVYVSEQLPQLGAETINASSVGASDASSPAASVANFFMSVASDSYKPIMGAWRRRPGLESWEDKDKVDSRTKYKITARYGLAGHRPTGLVTVLSAR